MLLEEFLFSDLWRIQPAFSGLEEDIPGYLAPGAKRPSRADLPYCNPQVCSTRRIQRRACHLTYRLSRQHSCMSYLQGQGPIPRNLESNRGCLCKVAARHTVVPGSYSVLLQTADRFACTHIISVASTIWVIGSWCYRIQWLIPPRYLVIFLTLYRLLPQSCI